MTRLLRIAFCGEGTTDSRVMEVLLRRLVGELSLRTPVDLRVDAQRWNTRIAFPAALVEVVRQATALHDLLVAHVDADASDERHVRAHKIEPALESLDAAHLSPFLVVWAIPIQAIEAWLIVSAEHFADALTGDPERSSGLSFPSDPEKVHRDEAKQVFRDGVYDLLARTRRQRRRLKPAQFLADVAEQLPCSSLRTLPSFRRFEGQLSQALATLGYVDGPG